MFFIRFMLKAICFSRHCFSKSNVFVSFTDQCCICTSVRWSARYFLHSLDLVWSLVMFLFLLVDWYFMFCLQIQNTLLKLALGSWWLLWPLQSFQKERYFVSKVGCGFLNWFRVDLCWNMSFLLWMVLLQKPVMCFKK